jgi:hypothetical protein
MKDALKFAVIGEGLTGVALLIVPNLVAWLLLGGQLNDVGVAAARVAGIALIGLSIACLPGRAVAGMLTYSALVMLYLGYGSIVGGLRGIFLWPAVALHGMLCLVLGRLLKRRASFKDASV